MLKRARLDDDGRRVRQLELELELACLRRQDDQEEGLAREDPATGGAGEKEAVDKSAPPPTLQPGAAAATAATQSASSAPAAATTPANSQMPSRGRGGRGRGARGGRFTSLDNRGLQTVFVCAACDKIYCQRCNAYEQARDYWARQ